MTASSATSRPPLITAGDAWIVLAVILTLFFPFGLGGGGSGASATAQVPVDATPFSNSTGATIGVAPGWVPAVNAEQQGWTTTGVGGSSLISIRMVSLPTPFGPGERLATFANAFVQSDIRSVGAVDVRIVEEAEITLASGLPGYRILFTDRGADGVRRTTLAIVATRAAAAAAVLMRGPRDSMGDEVIDRNEPYLRTLTPVGVVDASQPPAPAPGGNQVELR